MMSYVKGGRRLTLGADDGEEIRTAASGVHTERSVSVYLNTNNEQQ